jgi:hypothetical protein
VLPGISAKSASYLGWLHDPLELIDLPPLSDRLAVHGVLEPFDHGLEVPKAFLQVLHALRYRRATPGAHVPLPSMTLVRRLAGGFARPTLSGPINLCRLMT